MKAFIEMCVNIKANRVYKVKNKLYKSNELESQYLYGRFILQHDDELCLRKVSCSFFK